MKDYYIKEKNQKLIMLFKSPFSPDRFNNGK